MDTIVVGIDVSKDRLDVAIRPSGQNYAVARSPAGLRDLVERLKPLAPSSVALEATGGYETIVAASLGAAELPVVVVNPAQVRAFAQALGKRAKTDPLDASVIAHFVEATKPEVRPLLDADTQHLADLVARRGQKRMPDKRLQTSIARLLVALQKELSALEDDIDDAVRGSPAWRETEDLLALVPRVGKIVARTLIAELPELGTLDRRRIAALAGLAPWTRQSGQWKGKSLIGGGRARVRSALFMAAMVGGRCNPMLKAFRDKLVAAGKPKMRSSPSRASC